MTPVDVRENENAENFKIWFLGKDMALRNKRAIDLPPKNQ